MHTNHKTLYHGSCNRIPQPVFGAGKLHNDYGKGFYMTEDLELAKEWSVDVGRDGYVNEYRLRMDGLRILNLNDQNYCPLHWLTTLLQNRVFDMNSDLGLEGREYLIRNFRVPTEEYDVIIGYRADDSYFSYAQGFLNNMISLRTLTNALHLGNLGEQWMLKSQEAFTRIEYVNAYATESRVWFPKKEMRDRNAREEYAAMRYGKHEKGDIYMLTILEGEMTAADFQI